LSSRDDDRRQMADDFKFGLRPAGGIGAYAPEGRWKAECGIIVYGGEDGWQIIEERFQVSGFRGQNTDD